MQPRWPCGALRRGGPGKGRRWDRKILRKQASGTPIIGKARDFGAVAHTASRGNLRRRVTRPEPAAVPRKEPTSWTSPRNGTPYG